MAITTKDAQAKAKAKFKFLFGPRFEIFYALQALTDSATQIHSGWKQDTLSRLPKSFQQHFDALGASPAFWPAIGDVLEHIDADATYPQIISYLETQDPRLLQETILVGTLHDAEVVQNLLNGTLSLQQAVEKAPEMEQHWFSYIGLIPYREDSLIAQGMGRLVHHPEAFKIALLHCLHLLWDTSFKTLWENVQPQRAQSLEERNRLFESCSLEEFTKQTLLRIEVDEDAIITCKGTFRIPFERITGAYFMPSLFNDKRFFTYYEHGPEITLYFPYFDPSISLDDLGTETEVPISHPAPDFDASKLSPVTIFKALGDPTRYHIVSLIAQKRRSSAELAKVLDVSKPTISHHVGLLREAGLINEDYFAGSRLLSLKRDVIEHLSELTLGQLFSPS